MATSLSSLGVSALTEAYDEPLAVASFIDSEALLSSPTEKITSPPPPPVKIIYPPPQEVNVPAISMGPKVSQSLYHSASGTPETENPDSGTPETGKDLEIQISDKIVSSILQSS